MSMLSGVEATEEIFQREPCLRGQWSKEEKGKSVVRDGKNREKEWMIFFAMIVKIKLLRETIKTNV